MEPNNNKDNQPVVYLKKKTLKDWLELITIL